MGTRFMVVDKQTLKTMKMLLLFLMLISSFAALAQHVIVNSDGAHSTLHSTGTGVGLIVNPNGTHSTIHSTGKGTGVIVNPNGTHSTFHSAGERTKVIVNPNGRHSIFHSTEDGTNLIDDSDGTCLPVDSIRFRNKTNSKRWDPGKPKKHRSVTKRRNSSD